MNRIHALDGLRGVAALAVVIYHLTQVRLVQSLFPHGYLAVDFFFILSGFVVAKAYAQRLRSGMSVKRFAAVRAIRLMPLSVLGALAGFAVLIAKWVLYPDKVDQLWQIVASGVLNVFLLPTPFGGAVSHHELFPGNGPLWSLFFEVVANLSWAVLFVRLATKFNIGVVVGCAVCFAVAVVGLGHANFGWNVETSWFGLLRVHVGFLIGSLIHEFLPVGVVVRSKFTTLAMALVLVTILAVPAQSSVYDALCVLVLFPAVVSLSALVVVDEVSEQRVWAALGDLSYPLYVLHFPILLLASGLSQALGSEIPPALFGSGAMLASMASAWLALKLYDEPVRAKLLSTLGREARRIAPTQVVSDVEERLRETREPATNEA